MTEEQKVNKKTKNTQEEIEAALARATGSLMGGGQKGRAGFPSAPAKPADVRQEAAPTAAADMRRKKKPTDKKAEVEGADIGAPDPEPRPGSVEAMEKLDEFGAITGEDDGGSQVAMSVEDFGRKCFNLNVDARQCKYQSNKVKDQSIEEHLRSINKKIYDEARSGGYSTNILFRVAPNDYVNVQRIIDWYKAHGFQILNYSMTSSAPYGAGVGMMEYNFMVSWAEA
jgi:hypothetical protein